MRKGVDCDYDKGSISVDMCGTYFLTVNKFNKQQQQQKANLSKSKNKTTNKQMQIKTRKQKQKNLACLD